MTTPSDEALLDEVQRRSLMYFWEFGHPTSFMARDRWVLDNDAGDNVVTTGGTGMGVMAIIVGIARGWLDRAEAASRLVTLFDFLAAADRFHGVFPHFMNGTTGEVVAFGPLDDGGDLVETAFLVQGLIAARAYFDRDTPDERKLVATADAMIQAVEWDWHLQGGTEVLYWHWSPNHGWAMNHQIRGWNECLITYILAAGAAHHAIPPATYHSGFCWGPEFTNGDDYDGVTLPLGPPAGGPLFFTHYSFLGVDPRGLRDRYAAYDAQNLAHCRINHAHCVKNPGGFKGYSAACWGLTASDDDRGYGAHSPTSDIGCISPTAALSSFPYVPDLAMAALKHFHGGLGDRIWGRYGFVDGFNESADWYAKTYLSIDQGPIVVMIENWRSGLIWQLCMAAPEIKRGLAALEFTTERASA
jgi:hypothetical protein